MNSRFAVNRSIAGLWWRRKQVCGHRCNVKGAQETFDALKTSQSVRNEGALLSKEGGMVLTVAAGFIAAPLLACMHRRTR